jgi:hypothetical protein
LGERGGPLFQKNSKEKLKKEKRKEKRQVRNRHEKWET